MSFEWQLGLKINFKRRSYYTIQYGLRHAALDRYKNFIHQTCRWKFYCKYSFAYFEGSATRLTTSQRRLSFKLSVKYTSRCHTSGQSNPDKDRGSCLGDQRGFFFHLLFLNSLCDASQIPILSPLPTTSYIHPTSISGI